MTRLEALQALVEKMETGWHFHFSRIHVPDDLPEIWVDAYNGSLDAAKALHEAVLPGWTVRASAYTPHGNSPPYVHVFKMRMTEDDPFLSANSSGYRGDCLARAWLLTILRALITIELNKGEKYD